MRRIRVSGTDLYLKCEIFSGNRIVFFYILTEMNAERYILSVDERGNRVEPRDRRMFRFPEQVVEMADALSKLPFEKLLIQAGA